MSATATVRVMTPEEIAARAGGETPFLLWPERATVFAERAMRLRQLAGNGHPMRDFLQFMAEVALVQQRLLAQHPGVQLPGPQQLDAAARAGVAPLAPADWPRDPAWRDTLRSLLQHLRTRASPVMQLVLDEMSVLSDEALEAQADALLDATPHGLDLAMAPIVAAALQVYWTHLVLAVQAAHTSGGQPFGRIDDATVCPCCGSRPTASITREAGNVLGQRYLHCSLCSTQWHMVRIKCSHCLGTKSIAYQALQPAGDGDEGADRAAHAAVQAETCDECGHYLKIVHRERDPLVDPVADDLATLTLDLLVSEAGKQRHGVNLMLLFGEEAEPPPDPGGA